MQKPAIKKAVKSYRESKKTKLINQLKKKFSEK